MTSLTLNSTATARAESHAQLSVVDRISAFYHRFIETCPVHHDAELVELNDETLLDLGFDPASFRHISTPADPMARLFY